MHNSFKAQLEETSINYIDLAALAPYQLLVETGDYICDTGS